MKKLTLLCLSMVVFGCLTAQTIATDRPSSQTDNSSTLPKYCFQMETGILGEAPGIIPELRYYLLPTALIRFGLSDRIELRIMENFEKNNYSFNDEMGFSDLQIGTKIQLFKKESSKTELAFLLHTTIPIGTAGLSGNQYPAQYKHDGSTKLSEKYSLGYTVGFSHGEISPVQIPLSLLLGRSIGDKFSVFAEVYGEYVQNFYSINADAGLSYLITDDLQADFYFGSGINSSMKFWSVGFSWRIPKKSKDD